MQKVLQILLFCSMAISIQAAENNVDAMVPSMGIVRFDWELFPGVDLDQESHAPLAYPAVAVTCDVLAAQDVPSSTEFVDYCLSTQQRQGYAVIDGITCKLDALQNFDKQLHKVIHTDKRPYVCKFCEESFKKKDHLKEHTLAKHSKQKNFGCDRPGCYKRFVRARYLKKHKESHDRQNIKKNKAYDNAQGGYVCDYDNCGKVFKRNGHLQEHLLRHRTEKPYPCLYPQCGKSYIFARELKGHTLAHHAIK